MESSSIQPVFFVKIAKMGVKREGGQTAKFNSTDARDDLQVVCYLHKACGDENEMLCEEQTHITEWWLQFKIKSFRVFFSDCVKVSIKNIFHLFSQNLLCIKLFSVLVLHFLLLEEKNLFRM